MRENIRFTPESNQVIVKIPRTQFKKGETLSIPQGFEALLMAKEGPVESVQGVLEKKFESPVEIIYLVRGNRAVISSKWGTPNRLLVRDQNGQPQKMGAYGLFEFKLTNPSRYVITRMAHNSEVDEATLKKDIQGLIPEALNQVFQSQEAIDTTQLSTLISKLSIEMKKKLEELSDDLGLSIHKLVIEDVNFITSEGDVL
jgi:membrane protease subunit (stomatin/prohibitin family)